MSKKPEVKPSKATQTVKATDDTNAPSISVEGASSSDEPEIAVGDSPQAGDAEPEPTEPEVQVQAEPEITIVELPKAAEVLKDTDTFIVPVMSASMRIGPHRYSFEKGKRIKVPREICQHLKTCKVIH